MADLASFTLRSSLSFRATNTGWIVVSFKLRLFISFCFVVFWASGQYTLNMRTYAPFETCPFSTPDLFSGFAPRRLWETPNLVPRACVTLIQRSGQRTLWKNPKPEPENPGSGLIAPAWGFKTKWRLLIITTRPAGPIQDSQQDRFHGNRRTIRK